MDNVTDLSAARARVKAAELALECAETISQVNTARQDLSQAKLALKAFEQRQSSPSSSSLSGRGNNPPSTPVYPHRVQTERRYRNIVTEDDLPPIRPLPVKLSAENAKVGLRVRYCFNKTTICEIINIEANGRCTIKCVQGDNFNQIGDEFYIEPWRIENYYLVD